MDPHQIVHRVYWPIQLEGDNRPCRRDWEVVEGGQNMEEPGTILNLGD